MPGPTPEELRLHQRLLSGDETASGDVFARYLTPIIKQLSRREAYRGLADADPDVIWDAVSDALFAYVETPERYQPGKASLHGYLRMSAEGDLRNLLAKRSSRHRREEALNEKVEVGIADRNYGLTEAEAERNLREDELWVRIREIISDPVDQEIVKLILDHERSREAYARVLGISDWLEEERKREVDRVKDRLKKRLQRAGWTEFLDS
ncbi:MAG: hypothetical protein M3P51_12680 [Chloroflexota bacterium]|nr:hypothetical protein [Chloroflexota bacterium]